MQLHNLDNFNLPILVCPFGQPSRPWVARRGMQHIACGRSENTFDRNILVPPGPPITYFFNMYLLHWSTLYIQGWSYLRTIFRALFLTAVYYIVIYKTLVRGTGSWWHSKQYQSRAFWFPAWAESGGMVNTQSSSETFSVSVLMNVNNPSYTYKVIRKISGFKNVLWYICRFHWRRRQHWARRVPSR